MPMAIIESFWPDVTNYVPAFVLVAINLVVIFAVARILIVVVRHSILTLTRLRSKNVDQAKQKRMETANSIIISISKYVIYFLAIAVAIGELGLTSAMNSMLAAAGVGGLVLSIGAQSLVKDMATGVFMLFEDQVEVGDYVTIGDVSGTVSGIALRTITVKGYRGELHMIPNGDIGTITNYSRADYLAVVDVNIAYEADISEASRLLMEIGAEYAAQSDGKAWDPSVPGVIELGDSGVKLRLVVNVKPLEHWAAERELSRRIKERFEREGVEIPYNKVVVMHNVNGREGAC